MKLRRITSGILFAAFTLCALPSHAALVPPNFFDQIPDVETGQAGVEADHLEYNQVTDVITASGNVTINYAGYFARGDRLVFNQSTRDLKLTGDVFIVDPGGIEYSADSISVTGGLKRAVLNTMVMQTPEGTRITAAKTDKQAGGVTVMDDVAYTPCGACVDEHGHRIGWRVRTQRITYNSDAGYVDIEQPILEVLGVPIAWFPWLRLPDPADLRPTGFQFPSYQYNNDIGIKLNVPYYQALNRDMNFLLTPSLIQKQGVLLGARFNHNVGDWGSYNVRGHWIHQFDPAGFAGEVGNLDERWSLQTSGRFTPTENWTTGWSYMSFSDRDFVGTYMIAHSATNQVYANYLDDKTYFDIRAQEFLELGNLTQAAQDKQGANLPVSGFAHTEDLGDAGQVTVTANLRNVRRAADHTVPVTGLKDYAFGYEGNKLHGTAAASWQKQWIAPGGIAFEPTIGLRFDAARYDGASALNSTASTLYTATPFAALDVRYPWRASGNGVTHVVEPIAQVVYHGNGTSTVGITNDDAQSFVFDDTQVFSYNRFSGSDRQETGLRANIGGHYMVDFENGTWLDFAAGQSFHLAGANAFAQPDQTHIDKRAAFAGGTSEFVAGVNGRLAPWITFGAKAAFNPNGQLARTSVAAGFSHKGWGLGLDYAYAAPNAAIGANTAQQDVGGSLNIPVWEYWNANAYLGYDITRNTLIDYGAGLTYDDGYFLAGANVSSSGPLSFDPNAWTYKLSLKLKTADGASFGL